MPGQGNLSDLTDFRYLCHVYNCLKIQTIIDNDKLIKKKEINLLTKEIKSAIVKL